MIARRSPAAWRTVALATALFAITLNCLQPLAHAALLRDGAPVALWTEFCKSMAADADGKSQLPPASDKSHECCLGLAHVTAIVWPVQAHDAIEPTPRPVRFFSQIDSLEWRYRRGRPCQPRAPPLDS